MQVEVNVIRTTIYQFNVDVELDEEGYIDEEKATELAYKAYEKATEDNTLVEHYYDEDINYEVYV